MLNLVRPRYVLPCHGDYKRIRLHAELADAVGVTPTPSSRARTACRSRSTSAARGSVTHAVGVVFVDGVDLGDPADAALRDRRMLSADGIFIVVATISEQDGARSCPRR
jgi:ribonuclease J